MHFSPNQKVRAPVLRKLRQTARHVVAPVPEPEQGAGHVRVRGENLPLLGIEMLSWVFKNAEVDFRK